MFIKLKFLRALLSGWKTREGRQGVLGKGVSNITVGQNIVLQTWTLLVWWTVTSIEVFDCASVMLQNVGYEHFVPWASSMMSALRVYYECDHKIIGNVSDADVWEWDRKIKTNPNVKYFSFEGKTERLKWPVRPPSPPLS